MMDLMDRDICARRWMLFVDENGGCQDAPVLGRRTGSRAGSESRVLREVTASWQAHHFRIEQKPTRSHFRAPTLFIGQ
jgi:hypothetical protein